jgi:hypothetical protein
MLFTDSAGEKLVDKKLFSFLQRGHNLPPFLDRTVAARRPEKPAARTTGIIPGNRGKAGRSWCGQPLHTRYGATVTGKYHQFLWTVS